MTAGTAGTQVVVIGAGLAGLAAACHLTGAGYRVTVVERGDGPGGRAGLLERDGFSFDSGPSVLTMPELVGDALAAVGSRLADVLPMRRLDPAYRARFADGTEIRVRADPEAMREEIRSTCGAPDVAAFDDFVRWLTELYQVEMPHFIDRNFDSVASMLTPPGPLLRLLRLGGFGRLGKVVARRFADERLHRLFSFQALYAGLAPAQALAAYAVITYMDSVAGVWFPEHGGLHAVPVALAEAAAGAGAEFRYGTSAESLIRDSGGAVTGVQLAGGTRLAADAVVCTIDLPIAYQRLLPDMPPPRALRRARYSPSAVVWHVGAQGLVADGVAHHNIHFGADWEGAFDALLRRGQLMPDPSRLVTVPTVTDPSQAPAGCSTLFVLEPVPNLRAGLDWKALRAPMRDRLCQFLQANGYPTDVVAEELITPLDWEQQGMAAGTPFSLAHTFAQTGPFRPANVDRRVPGLVFAGSATVPGVGVPMVLLSGKLAAERVRAKMAR